ncbi:MAG: tyrosine-type recombinase/integrase [Anaerolineaceae bacterium]|nr:tyrosine-type recombinase/integrase [Anaerolineaceae bacterium]MDD5367497.1 tyrosine-type recombinase/integrase [Anaerolineaceae bacterium]
MDIHDSINALVSELSSSRSANTARTYRNAYSTWLRYLAESGIPETAPVEGLTIDHFIHFPSWFLGQKLSKATQLCYLAGIRALINWLVINGYLNPSYLDTIRLEKALSQVSRKKEHKLPRIPKPGQVEGILSAAGRATSASPILERDIAIVELLASSGCRNAEIAQLCVGQIDLVERRARVLGKGSKEAFAYFSTQAADALRAYWAARGSAAPEEPAFCRHDRGAGGRALPLSTNSIREIVLALRQAAGIESQFSPHYFRHAFGMKVLHDTGNLALTQDLMRHENPASTRVYATIDPDDLREAHRKIYQ